MRKIIVAALIAAVAVPSAAQAQSRAEIRNDRREVREERQELREARRDGDRRDVREERREYRDARQELREDRADRRSRYASPYRNWTYSRVQAGVQLRPAFYSSNYYVTDYTRRGIRRPGASQQWIRYGDDLLLVNVRTGRVLQAMYNRF